MIVSVHFYFESGVVLVYNRKFEACFLEGGGGYLFLVKRHVNRLQTCTTTGIKHFHKYAERNDLNGCPRLASMYV